MKASLQAATVLWLGSLLSLPAEPTQKTFSWDPPKVVQSMFSNEVGMLDTEREEYATNLSILAANQVTTQKASAQALADARRLLGLALHLSPRNKRAVVVNFQLSKGMLPEITQGQYSPQVFARLLLTRGQLLDKQGGEENKKLGRYFIQLAADLDPRNDDAVYHAEVQRLDHGDIDWNAVTRGATKPEPKSDPKPEPSPPANRERTDRG